MQYVRSLVLALAAVTFTFLTQSVQAQSLSVTGPSGVTIVEEGDDFATEVLNNAWDMTDRRDIGWEENFVGTSVATSSGVWTGTNEVAGGYVFPLFPGFKGSLFAEGLPGDNSLPALGINNRIDTSKYNYLSFKMSHTQRGTLALYWESNEENQEYWPDPNSPRAAQFDGFFHYNTGYANSGWMLHNYDMTNLGSVFGQVQESWSGNPFAFRIDPSVGGGVGAVTQFDWIRLVDPDSAPDHTVTWSSSGISEFAVITVFIDTNKRGFDGVPIARYTSGNNPGQHTFPTAMLPPGGYHFYIEAQVASGGSFQGSVVRSGYGASLQVSAKPQVVINTPSQVTGDDYATTELNNPWDMNEAGDLDNLDRTKWTDIWRQFSNEEFISSSDAEEAGTLFRADADPPLRDIGNNESDVQIHMNVSQAVPIDTGKYRYITYRMKVDETDYPSIHDKVERGWVSRPVFWNTDIINDAGRPKAHVVYEDWHTYTIDLFDSSIIEVGIPWRNFNSLIHLRVDPLETDVSTEFLFDWVKLTADNRAIDGSFQIDFTLADIDSDSFTVQLYRDTDKSGFNGTLIGTMNNVSAGANSFNWDTNGLTDGDEFYVYLVVNDGTNTHRVYADVPVVIGAYVREVSPRSSNPPYDYDGDGTSDQIVYRDSTGHYFYNQSTSGFLQWAWGGANFKPITGDFDGDGKADSGLIIDLGGFFYWYITRSSDGILYHPPAWGITGDDIVIADYNGNGRDEVAVFRAGAWFIYDETGAGLVHYWGLPGDIPMPRDYDGDGKDDLAIWRPTDGMWWIINSGHASGQTEEYFQAVQWGLPGDTPVAADWTGDGKADPAVFRSGLGMWFTRDIESGEFTATQWGLPGDIPMVGDYNGDGTRDFTVYRESVGTWYHNYRNGQTAAVQFGLPGDLLPDKAN